MKLLIGNWVTNKIDSDWQDAVRVLGIANRGSLQVPNVDQIRNDEEVNRPCWFVQVTLTASVNDRVLLFNGKRVQRARTLNIIQSFNRRSKNMAWDTDYFCTDEILMGLRYNIERKILGDFRFDIVKLVQTSTETRSFAVYVS